MNIYVGNLSYDVTDQELKEAFEAFGPVASVRIVTDKFTGKSKGFGFVEMEENGEAAIEGLDGKDLKGRNLKVNKAHDKPQGQRNGGGFRRNGGGGNGGGGFGGRGGRGRF